MATLYSLNSSSKGNCTLLVAQGRGLLIDCGLSRTAILKHLQEIGISTKTIDGLLLTHEHSDHICGLKQLVQRDHLPIYASQGTLDAAQIEGTDHANQPFQVGEFFIIPIPTSHDVADPCGYRIEIDGKALAVVTDTGIITPAMQQHLCGCSLIMLESNYDPELLEYCDYPPHLKRRIRSPKGHLSNEDSSALLALMALKGDLKTAVLAHLSENSNTPLTAKKAAQEAFEQYGIQDIRIEVGGPFCPPLEIE